MASTFTATNAGTTKQARAGVDVTSVVSTYELTAALVDEDVIQMVKIPSGAVICEVILGTDDLDTSTGLTLDVGDDGLTSRFIASQQTVGRAAGVCRLDQIGGLGYQYTADNTIDVHVVDAPSSGATSGTITLVVVYTMQDDV